MAEPEVVSAHGYNTKEPPKIKVCKIVSQTRDLVEAKKANPKSLESGHVYRPAPPLVHGTCAVHLPQAIGSIHVCVPVIPLLCMCLMRLSASYARFQDFGF